MKIRFLAKPHVNTDLYLIGMPVGFGAYKGKYAEIVNALLEANPAFKGNAGEIVTSVIPGADFTRFGLVGLGDIKVQDLSAFEVIGGKITIATITRPIVEVMMDAPQLSPEQMAAMGLGAALRAYEFKKYKTKNKMEIMPDGLGFLTTKVAAARRIYTNAEFARKAVYWTRDLVNEPSNTLSPKAFIASLRKILVPMGVKVRVIDMKALKTMGAGGIVGVGQASQHPPAMVVLEYSGAVKTAKPVALVGKGITYDTGGYSIKTPAGLLEMNTDMAGGAAVAGAMYLLAQMKAKVNVVGVLGIAENMIGGDAYKPTDIIKTLSGQTVEITNTDAEGRLVLADAMWYAQKTFKPRAVVDVATLTGAALVALGHSYAAVFANDEPLYGTMEAAAKQVGEKIWRMPLDKDYHKPMRSHVADMKNAGASRWGGACTAAAFLEKFVMDGVKWAHVDMAPTAVHEADTDLGPQGASGYGVRLLADFALKFR